MGSPGNKLGVDVGQKQKITRPEKRASPGFARRKVKQPADLVTHSISTLSLLDGGGEWKEGVRLAYKIGFKFPQVKYFLIYLFSILIFWLHSLNQNR